jgi:hypothetical protein
LLGRAFTGKMTIRIEFLMEGYNEFGDSQVTARRCGDFVAGRIDEFRDADWPRDSASVVG